MRASVKLRLFAIIAALIGLCLLWLPLQALAQTPSTITLTSSTTAYTAGQQISSNANGTLEVIPSFYIQPVTGLQVVFVGGHIQINDTLASSWNGQTIIIDTWLNKPTFASGSGDRSTFSASNTIAHLRSFTCTMSTIQVDGVYGECSIAVGSLPFTISSTSGLTVFWTATAATGSGTVTASRTLSFTPEIVN